MSLGPFGAAAVKTQHLEEEAKIIADRMQLAGGDLDSAIEMNNKTQIERDRIQAMFVWRTTETLCYLTMMVARIAERLETTAASSNAD